MSTTTAPEKAQKTKRELLEWAAELEKELGGNVDLAALSNGRMPIKGDKHASIEADVARLEAQEAALKAAVNTATNPSKPVKKLNGGTSSSNKLDIPATAATDKGKPQQADNGEKAAREKLVHKVYLAGRFAKARGKDVLPDKLAKLVRDMPRTKKEVRALSDLELEQMASVMEKAILPFLAKATSDGGIAAEMAAEADVRSLHSDLKFAKSQGFLDELLNKNNLKEHVQRSLDQDFPDLQVYFLMELTVDEIHDLQQAYNDLRQKIKSTGFADSLDEVFSALEEGTEKSKPSRPATKTRAPSGVIAEKPAEDLRDDTKAEGAKVEPAAVVKDGEAVDEDEVDSAEDDAATPGGEEFSPEIVAELAAVETETSGEPEGKPVEDEPAAGKSTQSRLENPEKSILEDEISRLKKALVAETNARGVTERESTLLLTRMKQREDKLAETLKELASALDARDSAEAERLRIEQDRSEAMRQRDAAFKQRDETQARIKELEEELAGKASADDKSTPAAKKRRIPRWATGKAAISVAAVVLSAILVGGGYAIWPSGDSSEPDSAAAASSEVEVMDMSFLDDPYFSKE